MLVNYNGTSISYDEIGNPNNWHNASSLTWNKRELSSLVLNDESTLSFAYNSNGIRKQKYYSNSNNSVTHLYTLDGTVILKEVIHTFSASSATSDILYYYYDETGVVGFEHNGTDYYFIKNLQGDIVSIYNNSGAIVVNYTYDAWGNILSVTGSLADTVGQLNPFRYRGYYYDSETGFYYLQSRYYDPSVGRFINADGYTSTGQGIGGNNLFVYCGNNSVIRKDTEGEFWLVAIIVTVVVCAPVIVQSFVEPEPAPEPEPEQQYVFYDNHRIHEDSIWHEQLIVADVDITPSVDLETSEINIVSAEIDVWESGWEFEHIDLSLCDFGHVGANMAIGLNGVSWGYEASAYSPSIGFTILGWDIEIGAEVLSVGGSVDVSASGFSMFVAAGCGYSVSAIRRN